MKIVKRILIITIIIFIQSLFFTYSIISNIWKKYNKNIKNFIKRLDKELRVKLI